MQPCPERATTIAFAKGKLASAAATRAQSHAASCAECSGIVAEAVSAPTIEAVAKTVPGSSEPALTLTAGGPPPAPAARTMIGRYRVLEHLGAGGMGVVYAAEDPDLDRKVAIKLMHVTSEHSARLVREARALAKLRHPHVITIYEVGREAQEIFIAMELVAGTTLRVWLRDEHSLQEKIDALLAAGRGLAAAHAEGLVHRDFKPENVMVGRDGRVQVLDFGLAKEAGTEEDAASGDATDDAPLGLTRTGAMLGTPAYMAPEQFAAAATDARTDQFAFCVTLFEAVHGHRPFDAADFAGLKTAVTTGRLVDRPLNPDVPAAVQTAIMRGMSVDPAARFPSMTALLDALAAQPQRSARPRWLVPALGAAAIAAIGTGTWIAAHDREGSATAPPPTEVPALLGSNAPPVQLEPLPGDPYKLTVHRLKNGLTVWISPNRKVPRIRAAFAVRAGNRDESSAHGVAHMVEHLMFTGTPRIGTTDHAAEVPHLDKLRQLYTERARAPAAQRDALLAQIDRETVAASRFYIPSEMQNTASALGIIAFNGHTDRDASTFVADLPSNKFVQWAELEGERWSAPIFRSFHAEAGIVFDELQQRSQRSDVPLYDALFAELFPGHPYGDPVGGTPADIVAEPFLETEQFQHTWFAPNNAALLLAGDIDPGVAIPTLERELARWKAHDVPKREARPVPPPRGAVARDVQGSDASLALVGWRGPAFADRDAMIVDVMIELARHLAKGYERRATLSLQAQFYVEAGCIVATARPSTGGRPDDAIAAVDELAATLRGGTFAQTDLDAVLANYRFDAELSRDDNAARVTRMAAAYVAGRTWADELADVARIAKLTKADIQHVAARYLTERRVVIRSDGRPYTLPDTKPPKITPLEPAVGKQSTFVAKLLAEETVEIPPRFVSRGRDYDIRTVDSGALIAVANTENTDYQLRLHWDIGARREPLLCAAMRALESAGTEEQRARWYARVERITFACSDEAAEVTVDGRDPQLDDGWRDALALLAGDTLTDDVWRVASAGYVQERGLGAASALPVALVRYAELGAASEYVAALPSKAILAATTRDARAALQKLIATRHSTTYFGPRAIGDLHPPAAAASRPPPAQVAPRRLPGAPPRIAMVDTGPNAPVQVDLVVSFDRLERSQLVMLRVYADYLAGTGGLLYEALRVKRGNTYGVYAVAQPRPDDAMLWIRVGAPPEQLADTLALVLATLRDRRIDAQHFEHARRNIEQGYRAEWIAPRVLGGLVVTWLRYGYDRDPRSQSFEEILRATPRELEDFTGRIASAPVYIGISGDLRAVDRAKLAPLGRVEVVDRAKLFAP